MRAMPLRCSGKKSTPHRIKTGPGKSEQNFHPKGTVARDEA